MERCPACRAKLNNSVVCKRCDCDLTLVFLARNQANKALKKSLQAIMQNRTEQAFRQAAQALQLDATSLAILVNQYLQRYPSTTRQTSQTMIDTITNRMNQSLKHLQDHLQKHR